MATWEEILKNASSPAPVAKKVVPEKDKLQLRKLANAEDALAAEGAQFGSLDQGKFVGLMNDLGISADDYTHLLSEYKDGIPPEVFEEGAPEGAASAAPAAAQPEAGKPAAAAPEGAAAPAAKPEPSAEDKALLEKIQGMSPEEWEKFTGELDDAQAERVMDLMGLDKNKVAAALEIYNNSRIAGIGMFDGWASANARMEKLASAPAQPAAQPAGNQDILDAVKRALKK